MAVRRKSQAGGGLGITARFSLALGGVCAVLFVIFGLVLQGAASASSEDGVVRSGVELSRTLASPGREGWFVEKEGKFLVRRGSPERLRKVSGGAVLSAHIDAGKAQLRLHKGEFKSFGMRGDYGDTKVYTGKWESGSTSVDAMLFQTQLLDTKGTRRGFANVYLDGAVIDRGLAGLRTRFWLMTVLCVLAVVFAALMLSKLVTQPIGQLSQAVSRLNRGNLNYRATIRSADEVGSLARALESMCDNLREGEEAQELLGEREQEAARVVELRKALLPDEVPEVPGFEAEAARLASSEGGSDFHDAVELEGGRLALVVASSSGSGLLATWTAALARTSLRAWLEASGDAARALKETNRQLSKSMRKGLHVTCQVAVLDPKSDDAQVFVAGHRAPFYVCTGGETSVVHGEGLALGLDEGAVFDRRLEEVKVEMKPGTRIVMTTVGAYEFEGEDGYTFGSGRLQDLVRKHAPKNSAAFFNLVLATLENHQGDREREVDATLVTAKRNLPERD